MIKEIANFRNEKGQYTSMVIDKNIKSEIGRASCRERV